jgi:hypothetical protein
MRAWIYLSFFCFLSVSGYTQPEAEIRKMLSSQAEAWNNGDINQFMQAYWQSPELLFLGSSGPTYGWDATLDRYQRKYPDKQAMGNLRFDIQKITERSKKIYTVVGMYMLDRKGLVDLDGYFVLLVQKIGNQWLIVADSTH